MKKIIPIVLLAATVLAGCDKNKGFQGDLSEEESELKAAVEQYVPHIAVLWDCKYTKKSTPPPHKSIGEGERGPGASNGGIFEPLLTKMAVFASIGVFFLPLLAPGAADGPS